MNNNSKKRLLSFILCIVLIAAMALFATGCSDKKTTESKESTEQTSAIIEKGEGATVFQLQVKDTNSSVTNFSIKTDKKTVGEALLELDLIAGDQTSYGLYVKTVNGVTADYDKDHTYWAFYINGNYATTGPDATDIVAGTTYAFVMTAA